jgi:hypothetical protein
VDPTTREKVSAGRRAAGAVACCVRSKSPGLSRENAGWLYLGARAGSFAGQALSLAAGELDAWNRVRRPA